ncbi:MAG: HAD-IC family P-type ATPase, partial [Caldilineaceae bacterium]|nr:HAD-IC family P-type ATPase [Caldilineaceae bacterium]
AKDVIADLHGRGFTLAIISGDQEEPTRRLAEELGIDQYFANTLPENKATLVEQLQAEGRSVCFVGDGINDSIALKKANVSISLRGSTTVATDTAQIVLMDQSLSKLAQLFTLATKFDKNLKVGFVSAIVPGIINIGGIFLFHWGIYTSMFIYNLSLLNNLGIAMLPLLRAGNESEQSSVSSDQ